MREAIRFEKVTKTFGKVVANKDVSFSVEKGKIYAILGENGSGKTTLMNVIAGIYKQDAGKVYINGKEAHINSPLDAFRYNVGMIHQHFKLVDVFTAVENVAQGLKRADVPEYKVLREERKELGTKRELKKKIKKVEKDIKNSQLIDVTLLRNQAKQLREQYDVIVSLEKQERKARRYSLKTVEKRMKTITDRYGFILDPHKHVYDMSVSEKQTLEIVKALNRGVNTLILDEPTAVLTPQETEHLFAALRNMKEHGNTVIIITHKLNEVMEISDKVVVLRKGEYIGEVPTYKATQSMLTEMMVGKKVELDIKRTDPVNPTDRLVVSHLKLKNKEGGFAINDVSFTAQSGEILGIAGISGNGQKELLESIAGLYPINAGDITLINPKKNQPLTILHKSMKEVRELAKKGAFHYEDGSPVKLENKKNKEIVELVKQKKIIFNNNEIVDIASKDPLSIREAGIHLAFVPEDRLGMGLVGDMDIVDNMMLRTYKHGKGPFLHREKPGKVAEDIIKELEVVTPSKNTKVRLLSGGNIQKVLVGREIVFSPKVFMTAYPVRGLDINSSYAIYNLLQKQKQAGVAVIYVGEDLDVLLQLCDRILVLCQGKVSGIFDPMKITKEELGLAMTGGLNHETKVQN